MDMETLEEFTADHTQINKGKRTKRLRPLSPFGISMASSSSSGGGGGGGGGVYDMYSSIPSPTISSEISTSTEEEEDLANCLILLAQSGCPRQVDVKAEKFTSRTVTTTGGKTSLYVYECKTCNRSFSSFQALGGHRASHKRPKTMVLEEKKATPLDDDHVAVEEEEEERQLNKISTSLSVSSVHGGNINNNKKKQAKIHECSICGSEFSSGQALGGHMRRHKTPSSSTRISTSIDTSSSPIVEKPRNILQLDLNLPAPEDDSSFQFTANQQRLVYSVPTLVDCHY